MVYSGCSLVCSLVSFQLARASPHHHPDAFSPPHKVRDSHPGIAVFNGTTNALTIVHIDPNHANPFHPLDPFNPRASENQVLGRGTAGLCPADSEVPG